MLGHGEQVHFLRILVLGYPSATARLSTLSPPGTKFRDSPTTVENTLQFAVCFRTTPGMTAEKDSWATRRPPALQKWTKSLPHSGKLPLRLVTPTFNSDSNTIGTWTVSTMLRTRILQNLSHEVKIGSHHSVQSISLCIVDIATTTSVFHLYPLGCVYDCVVGGICRQFLDD